MRTEIKLTFSMLLVAAFLSGCSIFGKKEEAQVSDEVVDAAMLNNGSMKVSGVIEGGAYRGKEDYSDLSQHGGKNGTVIPTEKFYSMDREKHAPVGKLLYVLTEDHPARCILGKYTNVEGRKRLVVYSKSQVPTNYCIYQKGFVSEPEGFSVYAKDGGICRPSFTVVKEDSDKRKLASVAEVQNTVSMAYCVNDTVSYGQELAKKKN